MIIERVICFIVSITVGNVIVVLITGGRWGWTWSFAFMMIFAQALGVCAYEFSKNYKFDFKKFKFMKDN